MKRDKFKIISLDGDRIELVYTYNEDSNRHFGNYPDFSEEPRYTPSGKPWVNVTYEDCPYCEGEYGDCGSCPHLIKEHEKDLIGICDHEARNKEREMLNLGGNAYEN